MRKAFSTDGTIMPSLTLQPQIEFAMKEETQEISGFAINPKTHHFFQHETVEKFEVNPNQTDLTDNQCCNPRILNDLLHKDPNKRSTFAQADVKNAQTTRETETKKQDNNDGLEKNKENESFYDHQRISQNSDLKLNETHEISTISQTVNEEELRNITDTTFKVSQKIETTHQIFRKNVKLDDFKNETSLQFKKHSDSTHEITIKVNEKIDCQHQISLKDVIFEKTDFQHETTKKAKQIFDSNHVMFKETIKDSNKNNEIPKSIIEKDDIENPMKTFEAHQRPISSVAFSPDGNIIASGSADKTIK